MNNYIIDYTEHSSGRFKVLASSKEEAKQIFLKKMSDGEYDFSFMDVYDAETKVSEEEYE